jgi:hypothetical protein
MAYKGIVLSYVESTGYGWIHLDMDDKKDYYFHIHECWEPVRKGDLIECDLKPSINKPGSLICVNTKKI